MSADYPGAIDMIITDPAWVFTDALAGIPTSDLTIVNHKTACGNFCTATDIANFFHNDTSGHKSAHFIVGRDGSVIQVVKLKDGAGANCCLEAGHNSYWDRLQAIYGNLNRCVISIEHEDWSVDNSQTMTPEQIDASNKLNLWLVKRYNLTTDQIHSHASMRPGDRARCPGPTFDFNQLFSFINAGGNGVTITANQQKEMDTVWLLNTDNPPFNGTPPRTGTGIHLSWEDAYLKGHRFGSATSNEYTVDDFSGNPMVAQNFGNALCYWRNDAPHWYDGRGPIVF